MPIIRKVIDVGRSKAVTIPKSWLTFYARQTGEEIKEVAVEVSRELKIVPYITTEKVQQRRGGKQCSC